MIHIPLLRKGRPYKSLETYKLFNKQTSETVCEVSMANRGLIAKDLSSYSERSKQFNGISIAES